MKSTDLIPTLIVIALIGYFGGLAVQHGAENESWRWIALGVLLWCTAFGLLIDRNNRRYMHHLFDGRFWLFFLRRWR
jgi:hypothetical protein